RSSKPKWTHRIVSVIADYNTYLWQQELLSREWLTASTVARSRVTDKTQDKTDLSSGDLKFQSIELSDLKVHVYGNTAVAAGTSTVRGTYKGQDISGKYRFTDTWVKRDDKWQVVATQATRLQQ
ncbi:MAG TPA: nuclear transport factor 2 family protein, partial [Terriglobales bacterium]